MTLQLLFKEEEDPPWLVVVEERLLESPLNVITITFTRGSINKQQWARLSGKYEPR